VRGAAGFLVLCGACAGAQLAETPEAPSPCEGADCDEISGAQGDLDRREAREEVLQAEEDRREAAFRGRLAELRAAEEARFRARAKDGPPPPPEPEEEVSVTDMAAELASLGPERPDVPDAPRSSPSSGADEADGTGRFGPTPRELLETSLCLLAEDERHAARELRARSRPREIRSAWALAMVELQALQEDILRERRHRGLADEGPSCTSEVKELLRALYGPGAARQGPDGTLRSVERLRQELQVRAGLPRLGNEKDDRSLPPRRGP